MTEPSGGSLGPFGDIEIRGETSKIKGARVEYFLKSRAEK